MPASDFTRTTPRVDPDNVFDRLSSQFLAEGVWEASRNIPDGSYGALLHRAGHEPWTVPGGVRTEVVVEVDRRRPGVLTEPQLGVAAELLFELAAVYRDEPLGALADEVARTIAAALDASPPVDH